MYKYILLIALTLCLISCNEGNDTKTLAETNSHGTKSTLDKSRLDSLINSYNKNKNFMGSISIHQNNKPKYSLIVGYADVENQKKSNSNTLYRIGSISKTFTAALILKAVEEGKLHLEQTIESFFPEIKNAGSITIENLLNHRSGIYNYTSDKSIRENHTKSKTVEEMLSIISNSESVFTPGSKAQYSNSNYYLLTIILEKTYNTTYGKLLQEKICIPLSLSNTKYGGRINSSNNEAYSYQFNADWEKVPEIDMTLVLGAGGIISTSSDLAVFFDALLNGKIISKKYVDKMLTIKNEFGLGIERYSYTDRVSYGHKGKIDGFNSIAFYLPEEKLSISLLANSSFSENPEIIKNVLKLYFNDAQINITEEEVIKYVGTYKSVKNPESLMVFERDKNILVHVIRREFREPLDYKGNGRFLFDQPHAPAMAFTFSADGNSFTLTQGSFEGNYIKEK